ncbi:DUF3592 domain-containing protein [Streptomyces sp. NPDC090082]|uniref:DUF3592 domain-containing protein n=1 Tax=unclassified Streptomyces TaxID=2593676 RepID=UPI00382DA783
MGDLIAMVLVTVTGLGGCVFGLVAVRYEVGLLRRGIRVDARVVGVRQYEDGDGDMNFRPIVAFTLPDGAEVRGESHSRIHEYQPPETISVVYDPRRPAEFSEGTHLLVSGLVLIGSVGMVLFGGWLLLT